MERNPYEVLGVPRDADAVAIHRAYRNLAKYWHPDLNSDPSAEERFKELAAAYDILSNADRRAQFDRENPLPAGSDHGERPHYSPDTGYSRENFGAELGAYVEKVRDEKRAQQIKPHLGLIGLAVWIGLAFISGMVRGFATDLDGIIVSATERQSVVPDWDELFFTSPVDLALYLVQLHPALLNAHGSNLNERFTSRKTFSIRHADGRVETFKPGPACSFLSGGAAIGSRIHKEAGHWEYELDGRVVSDLPYVGSRDKGIRRVNCFLYGSAYSIIFTVVLALGLLWRPAWTERWREQFSSEWGR